MGQCFSGREEVDYYTLVKLEFSDRISKLVYNREAFLSTVNIRSLLIENKILIEDRRER